MMCEIKDLVKRVIEQIEIILINKGTERELLDSYRQTEKAFDIIFHKAESPLMYMSDRFRTEPMPMPMINIGRVPLEMIAEDSTIENTSET